MKNLQQFIEEKLPEITERIVIEYANLSGRESNNRARFRERISNIIFQALTEYSIATAEQIIQELETNPNEDGSVSPNIQHWIEKKQSQLRKLFNIK
ncbi:MAG: hypothetical protein HY427_03195 [Candidatus Levybacteria bacterium]|nr:hypothetical protein [Candidatus Levybacteria bacterium]